ncbi:enoyl-CoA hydratase [Pelomonas sp. KK5]|uniref:enoyl-CoA hydratase n=1 Tax=Pelomonas sp. KK5 TaxID=1855730 RepID=UPI0018E95810|nr:enoyl-CoA hydratase [Pelomonas sp. KK5]
MSVEIDTPLLRVERPFAGCVLLTLDRPTARNALSRALRLALAGAFRRCQDDPEVRVVVLTGAGAAFCAGLDLKELGAAAEVSASIMQPEAEDPVLAMERFDGPIIGAINGAAVTGGFELALACDVLIASTQAVFADTHARVGVLPGWGLSQKLPRMIGPGRAKSLSLTGNFLDARRAGDWGLVSEVVDPGQLLPRALQLAADMASVLPEALPAYKRLIDDGLRGSLAEGLHLEKQRSAEWAAQLAAADIEQRRDAVMARGRQRKPEDY